MKHVTADFYVGNTHLGRSRIPAKMQIKSGFYDAAQTTAYFCRKCGDVWGRIVIEGDDDFKVVYRRCAPHGSGLFQRGVGTLWQHYPREVLTRELSIIAYSIELNPHLELADLIYNE